MPTGHRAVWLLAVVMVVGLLTPAAGAAADDLEGDLEVVTTSVPGSLSSGSFDVSPDGRWLVFATPAKLDPSDVDGLGDLYLEDTTDHSYTLVTTGSDASNGGGAESNPVVSDDGTVVAFASMAQYVPDDTNGTWDVYVKHVTDGTYTLVSRDENGGVISGNLVGIRSHSPQLSGDGHLVVFTSSAEHVAADVDGTKTDLYAYDLDAGTMELVDVDSAGLTHPDPPSGNYEPWPSVSADGNRVVFQAPAILIDPDSSGFSVFLRDRAAGTTTNIGQDPHVAATPSRFPDMSDAGNLVVLRTSAALVPEDLNGTEDSYLYFPATQTYRWNVRGAPSAGGDWLVYLDESSVPPVPSGLTYTGVRRYDVAAATSEPVFTIAGYEPHPSAYYQVTADGNQIFFLNNNPLVCSDTDAGWEDVYRIDLTAPPTHDACQHVRISVADRGQPPSYAVDTQLLNGYFAPRRGPFGGYTVQAAGTYPLQAGGDGAASLWVNVVPFFGLPVYFGSVAVRDQSVGLQVSTPVFFAGSNNVVHDPGTGTTTLRLDWFRTVGLQIVPYHVEVAITP